VCKEGQKSTFFKVEKKNDQLKNIYEMSTQIFQHGNHVRHPLQEKEEILVFIYLFIIVAFTTHKRKGLSLSLHQMVAIQPSVKLFFQF
jgi:prolipoprotein diacylglyceryltransferase